MSQQHTVVSNTKQISKYPLTAPINHIIQSSCVDGPGNRTVVFFQGCNMSCLYCHNPETICQCNHCGACVGSCPSGSLTHARNKVQWDEATCTNCGICHLTCPHSASPRVKEMSVYEVLSIINNNKPFIRGITLSGGECSLHRDFVVALFRQTKALGLSTLMDSNGLLPLYADDELMEVCDGVMLDIKSTRETPHYILTGQKNGMVLQNAVELTKMGKLSEVRTVVLPPPWDNETTIRDTAALLLPYSGKNMPIYKLLRFRSIGVRGEAALWHSPSDNELQRLVKIANQCGLKKLIVV